MCTKEGVDGLSSLCSSVQPAVARLLELEPAAPPATVLESESMGRERRVRGFHFDVFGHGKRKSVPAAAADMASTCCC